MLARDEDVLAAAESWREAGRDVAIATVVETWGSAPRPIGSHLVIDAEGNFLGSVSGGCVEGAVVEEAADVIADGAPRMLGRVLGPKSSNPGRGTGDESSEASAGLSATPTRAA